MTIRQLALRNYVFLGHTDLVELLLGRGANYSLPDKNGVRPLHLAAQGNFGKTVTVMLKDGRVEDIPDSEGRTALMWAVAKGKHFNGRYR